MQVLKYVVIIPLAALFFLSSCSSNKDPLYKRPDDTTIQALDEFKDISLRLTVPIDILMLIDSSGSMRSHQDNMIANLNGFLDILAQKEGLDLRFAVHSMDMDGRNDKSEVYSELGVRPFMLDHGLKGKLRGSGAQRYITSSDLSTNFMDASAKLKGMVQLGGGFSGTEVFLEPLFIVLDPNNKALNKFNQNFLRENAFLVLFILTDTADQSDQTAQETYDYLLELKKGDPSKLLAFGALANRQLNASCQTDPVSNSSFGKNTDFLDLFSNEAVQAAGEKKQNYFDLCSEDFGKEMSDIALQISSIGGLRLPVRISQQTVGSAPEVQVYVGNVLIEKCKTYECSGQAGWIYNISTNSIYFKNLEFTEDQEQRIRKYMTNNFPDKYNEDTSFDDIIGEVPVSIKFNEAAQGEFH